MTVCLVERICLVERRATKCRSSPLTRMIQGTVRCETRLLVLVLVLVASEEHAQNARSRRSDGPMEDGQSKYVHTKKFKKKNMAKIIMALAIIEPAHGVDVRRKAQPNINKVLTELEARTASPCQGVLVLVPGPFGAPTC